MAWFSAALIFVMFLLPGALFAWGFEFTIPLYGKNRKDWWLRLAVFSAIWLAAIAGLLHLLYIEYWEDLSNGKTLPWLVYLLPILYLVAPAFAGWVCGWFADHARKNRWVGVRNLAWAREPTAWDHLFATRKSGFIRCRLTSGRWVGGLYDNSQEITSYASLGEGDRDIYIGLTAEFDQRTGDPQLENERIVWFDSGIYLSENAIEFIEFIQLSGSELNKEGLEDGAR